TQRRYHSPTTITCTAHHDRDRSSGMPDPHHPPPPALRADDIDLTLLRTFLAAHRAGSTTKAAAELGLSQPGVTSQLRRLERRLGVTLFHRAGRGLTPTAAGDELALRIGPHLDALTAALNEAVTTDESPFTRTVLLGGPPELTAVRVLPSLAGLYPRGLRVRVTTGLADDLLAELAGGGLDLVVSTIRPRGRAITGVPIADEEFVLVASPDLAAGLDRDRPPARPAGGPAAGWARSSPRSAPGAGPSPGCRSAVRGSSSSPPRSSPPASTATGSPPTRRPCWPTSRWSPIARSSRSCAATGGTSS